MFEFSPYAHASHEESHSPRRRCSCSREEESGGHNEETALEALSRRAGRLRWVDDRGLSALPVVAGAKA
ncbi:MAG TPA: hypothetical protein EYQ54_03950 [Myxococcales bacterium]|nr:hypothetical protein [Myxococcales bacterium]HIL81842.1 hypothetical protein [Myxococcales bacterium]